ncbi:MAG: hypothetical protein ABJ239_03390 [Erythrobacter sp.]
MIHIHPFPARMAPEIALKGLDSLPADYSILDPMSGSGMVIGTASKLGLEAIGYDLDPLACLISKVNGTPVDPKKAEEACAELVWRANKLDIDENDLLWVDSETRDYIHFWFAPSQRKQLAALSYLLNSNPFLKSKELINLLKVAVSRLIVTKEPKASLARDTAHSRPHRTISENDFDVLATLPGSLKHVLKALRPSSIKTNAKTYRGDARRMGRVRDESIDRIVTSPPYLNAIDYMRGHRLSLVWLGFSVGELRKIRSRSVGAEIVSGHRISESMHDLLAKLPAEIDDRKRRMLVKYHYDLCGLLKEAHRVLRKDRQATYVIGNSNIKGHEIMNSDMLVDAATSAGFVNVSRSVREIPENRRYMPLINSGTSSLAKRMRTEHVITFAK